MDDILYTNGLSKQYRNFKALDNLNMHIPRGAIYGFVGKNGAEKEISKSRRRMGAVVETPSIYLNMTAEENLKEQYRVLGMPSFEGHA